MQKTAYLDPELRAVLTDLAPLTYADIASAEDDRPAHVRAASALRRQGARLVIVQDDVNVLFLRGPDEPGHALLLPLGPGGVRCFDDGRGNKHEKMDLEACVVLPDGRLVAFGSGSTALRKQLVVAGRAGDVRVVAAPELYAELEQKPAFCGSELNVEGALVIGDTLRFFQRGNGKERDGVPAVNATGDFCLSAFLNWLDSAGPPPTLDNIVENDLGSIGRARFGFTDATLTAAGVVAFVACAEDSPDVVRDGAVLGCRFGLFEPGGVRMADVVDASGNVTTLKIEGIEAREDGCFDVVIDVDDPSAPALLGRLTLELRSKR